MLLNVEVRLVPTSCIALIAATAISAAIRPYSIAVAPSSFFHNATSVANIQVLLWRLAPRATTLGRAIGGPSVVKPTKKRRSLKLRRDVVEGRSEAGSNQLKRADRGNRNQGVSVGW